jgi:hypothetical protein
VTHAIGVTTMKTFDKLSDHELLCELRRADDALPDAPPALLRAAIDLWRATPASPSVAAAAVGLLRRLTALLSFDSWAAPLALQGMRSLRSPTRQLLFSADHRDIDLRVTPTADVFSIKGQVLGPDTAGSIELLAQGTGEAAAHGVQLDALGEFHIDGVRRGSYVMTLRLNGDEIVLPALDVGAPGDEA